MCWAESSPGHHQAPVPGLGKVTKMWSLLAQGRHVMTLTFSSTGKPGGSSPTSSFPSSIPLALSLLNLLWTRTQSGCSIHAVSVRKGAEAPSSRRQVGQRMPGSPTAPWELGGEPRGEGKPSGAAKGQWGKSEWSLGERSCVSTLGLGGVVRVCQAKGTAGAQRRRWKVCTA